MDGLATMLAVYLQKSISPYLNKPYPSEWTQLLACRNNNQLYQLLLKYPPSSNYANPQYSSATSITDDPYRRAVPRGSTKVIPPDTDLFPSRDSYPKADEFKVSQDPFSSESINKLRKTNSRDESQTTFTSNQSLSSTQPGFKPAAQKFWSSPRFNELLQRAHSHFSEVQKKLEAEAAHEQPASGKFISYEYPRPVPTRDRPIQGRPYD